MGKITQEILKQLRKDATLIKLNKDINQVRKIPFDEMEQLDRDTLGHYNQDIEEYLSNKYNMDLNKLELYPEEFLDELFGYNKFPN